MALVALSGPSFLILMVCVPTRPRTIVGKSGVIVKRASLTAVSAVIAVGLTITALTELLTGVYDEVDSIVAVLVNVPTSVAVP